MLTRGPRCQIPRGRDSGELWRIAIATVVEIGLVIWLVI